jgi:uncharacterized membrane protein YhaH (DUF805 family)
MLVGLGVGLLVSVLGEAIPPLAVLIYAAWLIVATWISLASQVKRWHDLNKSGWMGLLNFTLVALPVVIIFLGCVRGTTGLNRFGADPLPPPSFDGLRADPPPVDAQQ